MIYDEQFNFYPKHIENTFPFPGALTDDSNDLDDILDLLMVDYSYYYYH